MALQIKQESPLLCQWLWNGVCFPTQRCWGLASGTLCLEMTCICLIEMLPFPTLLAFKGLSVAFRKVESVFPLASLTLVF